MAYTIKVIVCDKNSGKGISGQRVKQYGQSEQKTDSDGNATVIVSSNDADIYVNGCSVYRGSASNAPRPIVYEK